ncbi:hypothetical protein [Muribaculum intestinale]|uniref:hypothetical protein n=1 Tax=Muribaculum intestinale TaxID=1796646 RepID=UPI00242FD44B|nr:hypothetical protein [Muribaculum intestinale]
MEKLTVNKADAVKYYNAASEDTKEVLRELFGAEAFKFDFRSIKTYADACHHLGMSEHLITGTPDCDKEALQMASAAYKLIVICKALNNGQQYDENGSTWCPIYWFYTKEELEDMGEEKRKAKGIKLLSAAYAGYAEFSGVRCAVTSYRCAITDASYGFPLVLNSEEKAKYVAEQFEALIFQCYGIKVKEEAE